MYFLLPTLLVVLAFLLVIRAAAIGLMMTGLDEKRARFQALSAFQEQDLQLKKQNWW
ncbi:hypothetical protein LM597_04835 [Candidatus Acetothermia bacterium]|nr:hypothetical protein [Candidatus Acetothermia bacterium]